MAIPPLLLLQLIGKLINLVNGCEGDGRVVYLIVEAFLECDDLVKLLQGFVGAHGCRVLALPCTLGDTDS